LYFVFICFMLLVVAVWLRCNKRILYCTVNVTVHNRPAAYSIQCCSAGAVVHTALRTADRRFWSAELSQLTFVNSYWSVSTFVLIRAISVCTLQVECAGTSGTESSSGICVIPAHRTSNLRQMWSQVDRDNAAAAASYQAPARRTPSINRRSASAHRDSTRLDD